VTDALKKLMPSAYFQCSSQADGSLKILIDYIGHNGRCEVDSNEVASIKNLFTPLIGSECIESYPLAMELFISRAARTKIVQSIKFIDESQLAAQSLKNKMF
jgi:hypothetical protein